MLDAFSTAFSVVAILLFVAYVAWMHPAYERQLSMVLDTFPLSAHELPAPLDLEIRPTDLPAKPLPEEIVPAMNFVNI